jgi:hypothetical protein
MLETALVGPQPHSEPGTRVGHDLVLDGDAMVSSTTIAYPEAYPMGSLPPFSAIRGHARVLALHKTLSDLAERCGQSGVVAYLPFFLSACRFGAKIPHVLLLPDSAGELQAAVLLYEYGIGRASSGIFVPADHCGERTVIAPEPLRSLFACRAAEFLIDRGAHLVFLALRNGDFKSADFATSSDLRSSSRTCATRRRIVLRTLRLASTLDATLAGLGSHTRRNLRHFRRLAESEFGATFVPEADLFESDFLALNRQSLYPVVPWVVRWRFRYARNMPGSIFAGLQTRDGRWLSMIGGRRRNGTTYIDWQMNLKDFPCFSLGTALRAYLLEHEIARGTQLLTFEDGTPHSMNRAFVPENVTDLLLARRSLSPDILRKVAAHIPLKHNVLAGTILDDTLVWNGTRPQATH